MKPPVRIKQADYLVLESTYGNRLHDPVDPQIKLAAIINKTIKQRGIVLIPYLQWSSAGAALLHPSA